MNMFESVGRAMVYEAVAQHDEFSIDLDDGWVHVLDGDNVVRLSMPKDIWDGLIKKYLGKK